MMMSVSLLKLPIVVTTRGHGLSSPLVVQCVLLVVMSEVDRVVRWMLCDTVTRVLSFSEGLSRTVKGNQTLNHIPATVAWATPPE